MRSFIAFLWCYMCLISKTSAIQSDLIHFGVSPDESKEAAYYLAVDSEFPNTGPSDELKRTQRSFWKKLFKNGLFGECDNCCNNCQYNVGDGTGNYNVPPAPGNGIAFPNWQPFQPIQPWRSLQPFFGGNCGNRCGYNQYAPPANNDNYGNNPSPPGGYSNNYGPDNYAPATYGSNEIPAPEIYSKPNEPAYETPEPSPPASDTAGYVENPSASYETPADTSYEKPADYSNNTPAQTSSYSKDESSALPYADTKVPQILYQPIIYVSPQYLQQAANKLIQDKSDYLPESKGTELPTLNNYAAESPVRTESEQSQYNSPALNAPGYNVSPYNTPVNQIPTNVSPYNTPVNQIPVTAPVYSQSYSPSAQSPLPCTTGGQPSVSTVSTLYTVISPSLLSSAAIVPQTPCSNSGPSKYSLYPSNSIPMQGYSENKPPSLPAAGPVYGSTAYTAPILTLDDQPYRECPELFTEYNRQHNNISPYSQANSISPSRTGNTFVNSQFISY